MVKKEQSERMIWETAFHPIFSGFGRFPLERFDGMCLKHNVSRVVWDFKPRLNIMQSVTFV